MLCERRVYSKYSLKGYVYTGPDRNCSEPNWTGSASVYRGPFLDPSGTDPNGSKIGPVKKRFQFWIRWIPTGPVPERFGVNRRPISDRIRLEPVPCKRRLISEECFFFFHSIQARAEWCERSDTLAPTMCCVCCIKRLVIIRLRVVEKPEVFFLVLWRGITALLWPV